MEDLKPLGNPTDYGYTARNDGEVGWRTWALHTHIDRLYKRCDELLAEVNELKSKLKEQTNECDTNSQL